MTAKTCEKRAVFVREYLVDRNGTRAAIAAGNPLRLLSSRDERRRVECQDQRTRSATRVPSAERRNQIREPGEWLRLGNSQASENESPGHPNEPGGKALLPGCVLGGCKRAHCWL